MKKYFLAVLLVLGVASLSQAQKYRTAAGIRLGGDEFGATLQQKLHEKGTIEGIAMISSREYSGTALYQWHFPILGKRLNYYLGAGGHVGKLKDQGVFTGVDGILGIEYKINGLPFLLSADVKPAVHINHEDWVKLATGISVRYVILAEKKEKKKLWPFGKKEEEKKSGWPFGKKEEEEEKPGWPFGKKKEAPVQKEPEKRLDLRKIFQKQQD